MISDEARGPIGRWLKHTREAKGYPSQAKLLEALARRGIVIHASVYATMEARGKADTPGLHRLVERIADFYGMEPPGEEPAGQGSGDVAAAIDRNTAAVIRQAEAVEALLARMGDFLQGQAALAFEVGRIVDPQAARRQLPAALGGTPRERSEHDPASTGAGK